MNENQKQILSNTGGEWEGRDPGMEGSLAKAPSLPFPSCTGQHLSWQRTRPPLAAGSTKNHTGKSTSTTKSPSDVEQSEKQPWSGLISETVSKRPNSTLLKFLLEYQSEWESDLGTENITT